MLDICKDCFAYRSDLNNGDPGCIAIDDARLTGKEKTCSFHKTREEQKESINKAKDRQLKVFGFEVTDYASQIKGVCR